MELEIQDQRLLEAAKGWLGLDNWHEANEELERITPEMRAHPDVLIIRWHVYARAQKWLWALTVARTITEFVPDKPFGWIHMAFSLHELKRTQEALEVLLPVVDKFPDDSTMRYNLACYECQLGRLKEAEGWLHKAFDVGDVKKIKLLALEDPDLKPLWPAVVQI